MKNIQLGLNIRTNEIRNAICHYNNKPEVGARAKNTVTVQLSCLRRKCLRKTSGKRKKMCSTSSSLARYMVMHAVRKCVYPFLLHVQPLAHALAISHMHVWLTNLSQSIQRQKVCGTRLEKGKRYDFQLVLPTPRDDMRWGATCTNASSTYACLAYQFVSVNPTPKGLRNTSGKRKKI